MVQGNPQAVDNATGKPAAPPPVMVPVSPPQSRAVTLSLHQRLRKLRDDSRQQAAKATVLTNVAAAITAVISALNVVVTSISIPIVISGLLQSSSTANDPAQATGSERSLLIVIAVTTSIMLPLTLSIFGYSIYVLSIAGKLYHQSYQDAWEQLNRTSLALAFAQEDFSKHLHDTLTKHSYIKLIGPSAYKTLEEHLDWCACHFPSLRGLAHDHVEPNIWMLRREEGIYKNRKWFMQDKWVYWALGCLLFVTMRVGYLVSLLYVMQGGRFINSRGVLVALCDMLLRLDADETVPPDTAGNCNTSDQPYRPPS